MSNTQLTKLEALVAARSNTAIHAYFDHSGINDAVTHQSVLHLLTELAQKYDRQLFVNTFSHLLSDEALLDTKEPHTFNEVWVQYSALYKVQGGTDFSVVWKNIHSDEDHAERINLLVTDFQWAPRRDDDTEGVHPKNLHYLSLDELYFQSMGNSQLSFVRSMAPAVEPEILDRLLDKGSNNLSLAVEKPAIDWEARCKVAERDLAAIAERHWPAALIGSVARTEADQKAQMMATEIRNVIEHRS